MSQSEPGAITNDLAHVDQHLGARLRRRRLQLGLTQADLAKELGVTFQQIQKYETGLNRIAAAALVKMAGVLETPPSYFFDGLIDRKAPSPSPA